MERSFAQVQPSIFPNNRPATYFEHGDSFRVPQSSQQPLYSEGHVRFPSPNYNQNPAPFQLPTGRSQPGVPYYANQADFSAPQRQRFRPALPYNFQLVHPASTKRPELPPQIHSAAYQNDPSKPETFLGQITINNPDIDYLQNSRYKNIPFDNNSLKSNGQSGHINHDEDIDNENQDLFDHPRVTTYNPNKLVNKQRLNIRPDSLRLTHHESPLEETTSFQNAPNKLLETNNNSKISKNVSRSKENKALLDLEPLLEDDISDISTFRELMKNTQGSFDVQVIKSNNSSEISSISNDDSKPDASSMNADNLQKITSGLTPRTNLTSTIIPTSTNTPLKKITDNRQQFEEDLHSGEEHTHSGEEEEEYEYYDETESSEIKHTTLRPTHDLTEHATDIYDDYDATEEPEVFTEEPKSDVTESFHVVMKSGNATVKDENFKHFVDTTIIDQPEEISNESLGSVNTSVSSEDVSSIETPSILGEEVVSVVTTKSVVNGTISIPDVTFAPRTTKKLGVLTTSSSQQTQDNDTSLPVTTENWIVVASVQTSRSVSGARFLPFLTVEQDEKKQVLADDEDEDEKNSEEFVTRDPKEETSELINSSSSSTENINDKLDSIQSELSSAVLSGSLNNGDKNIKHITETTTEAITTSTIALTTTTMTTPATLNVFTLKSTEVPTVAERSSPDPPPVLIKKFTPRITTSTTPKPRKKPSFVTVMDELPPGFLPSGYKQRHSYKDKRTSTTTSTTTTTTTTTTPAVSSTEDSEIVINGTQGRSSGISSKNKVILLDDKSLLPKEYRPKEKVPEDLFKKFQKDDLNKFLPSGYKPPASEETEVKSVPKTNIFDKIPIQEVDIRAFLPKDFKLNESTSETPELPIKATHVDITAFLPPDFKLNETKDESDTKNDTRDNPLRKFKVTDVSSLLPPGFSLNNTDEPVLPSSTQSTGNFKVVFPSRPGNKNSRKTTPKPSHGMGPPPVTPAIKKGWPTR